jgi:plasmid stabilization system protein ParE
MKYRIVSLPTVQIDIREAVGYYQQFNPKLGHQFVKRIQEAYHFLELMPKGFQQKYKTVRTLLLKQFPFQLHYLIDDHNQTIIVLAVIHSYRNPKDYSSRL